MNKQQTKKLANEAKRKTAEVEAKRAKAAAKEAAQPFVESTFGALNAVRKSNSGLFVSIKEAYDALYVPEAKPDSAEMAAFNHYRIDVLTRFERSSFNKCLRICKNDLIMSNLDRLPVAWSTLSMLDRLLSAGDRSIAETFIELLDSGKITSISSAKSIFELLTPESEAKKYPTSLTVVFYSDQIALMNEADRQTFEEASAALETIGFVMKDMSKKTVEAVNEEASNDASSDATDSTDSVQEAA